MKLTPAAFFLALCCTPAFAISYRDDPALQRIERTQETMVQRAQRAGELTPLEQRRLALADARNDMLIASLRLIDGRLSAEDRARALAALDEETALIRELADSARDPDEGRVHRDDGGPAPWAMARRN